MADQSADKYPPSITVAKLYERTSQRGRSYMTGRMGGVKVVLLKTDDTDDKGNPIWEMKFSQAPAWKGDAAARSSDASARTDSPQASHPGFGSGAPEKRSRGFTQEADDQIPF